MASVAASVEITTAFLLPSVVLDIPSAPCGNSGGLLIVAASAIVSLESSLSPRQDPDDPPGLSLLFKKPTWVLLFRDCTEYYKGTVFW